jgi:hypothetical protein
VKPRIGLVMILSAASALATANAQTKLTEKQPETDPAQKERIEAALKLTVEAAGKYELKVGNTEPAKAKLIAEPVLRWSNPNVGEIYGNVFLWTAGERPVAIGSLFKWFSPHTHTSHEFMSLTEQHLAAAYDGKEVWATKLPGLTFVPLKGAEPPADSAIRRQAQIRQLARRFTASETTREGDKQELRLLSQPIYKYEAPKEKVASGGVFAFVLGTDPEIVFLLEARGEKPAWHVAAARLQNCALQLEFDGKKVWSAEQLEWKVCFDHSQPYTLFDTPGK